MPSSKPRNPKKKQSKSTRSASARRATDDDPVGMPIAGDQAGGAAPGSPADLQTNGRAWTRLSVPDYLTLRRVQARGVYYERICAHLGVPLERVRTHYRWFSAFERANVCVQVTRFFDEPAGPAAKKGAKGGGKKGKGKGKAKGKEAGGAAAASNGTHTPTGASRLWAGKGRPEVEILGDFRVRYEDDNYTTPIYVETFKTSPSDARECFADGTLLFTWRGIPMALRLEFGEYDEAGKLTVHGPETDTAIAALQELYQEVDRRITEEPIYAGHIITPHARFLELEPHNWDELILSPDRMKELKRNTVELLEKLPIYQRNNLPLKRGLILAGPPGTGKTLAGKVLAQDLAGRRLTVPAPRRPALNAPSNLVQRVPFAAGADAAATTKDKEIRYVERPTTFLWVSPKDIEGPYSVEAVYNLARRCTPTVVFFEDMDLYLKDREEGYRDNPILGEFLNQLDGPVENAGVITILTTNYLDTIEQALKDRPGRFDVVIRFDLPDAECRELLLRRYTKSYKTGKMPWTKLAGNTKEMSGAQIRELISQAAIHALEEGSLDKQQMVLLKESHFSRALKTLTRRSDERIGFNPPAPKE
ncbi:MAG: AAA family ATPase [Planctomycetota bacterium]